MSALTVKVAGRAGTLDCPLSLASSLSEVAQFSAGIIPPRRLIVSAVFADKSRVPVPISTPSTETLAALVSAAGKDAEDFEYLRLKDIGPQIGYRTTFLLEYLLPLAAHVFFPLRALACRRLSVCAFQASLSLCFIAHFVKRIIETLFVHTFSRATMPVKRAAINISYYTGFAVLISRAVYAGGSRFHPQPTCRFFFFLGCWLAAELCNGLAHLHLRLLRDSRAAHEPYSLPRHPVFGRVTCANYLYEILGWASLGAASRLPVIWVFTAFGTWQMHRWALQKHRRLQKLYPEEMARRWPLVPFLRV
eukprot:gnl/Ergobibamus_cyprinoides/534.p1 GENE.gnl/Ergobibamus_cyprinoides/534~~gnl/Ergobibamus_cyprinoides/534.p1  ORF type:complete len:322 (+),score=82.80 gnl/Ergobibamus_cyprinoides/534:50-967(+)